MTITEVVTIREVEKLAKKVEEWTEEEFRSLYGRSLTLEEFCRLYELAQTEEPQQFLQLLEQCLRAIYSGVNNLDLSKFPTERILDRIRNGDHIAWDFYNAISEYQQSTAVDATLLFILLHIATVMLQILFRYIGEIASRLLKMPIGFRILQLMAWEDSGIPPVEKDESGNVQSYVLKMLLDQLRTASRQLWLPQEAKSHQEEGKDEISHILITTKLNELRELKFDEALLQAISGTIELLRRAAKTDVIDKIREQTGQSQNPEGGFEYMDAVGERKNGTLTSVLELLEANESLQIQPEEELPTEIDPYDDLVADIREEHGDDVAETAKVYFEIYFQQDKPGKKVKQRQVAQALGKNRKTISRHCSEKIEHFLRERMKKN